ncbi:2208_t:CDS:2 [Dentiscutata erythropus]|uniref:2208_t:CDS:1 n=1 Tax=Dentiscutata erythropus TaxID=1348616 RepID=A0A9N9NGM0_9GLOM|nr:2208_t:CDS:2 [Dentiscutata erythropus]
MRISQSSTTKEKPKARELPCLFSYIVSKYNELGLRSCKTKESQTWRNADTSEVTKRLRLYEDFMSELKLYLNPYAICEKHYNQVISTNYFYRHLLDNPNSSNPISINDSNIREEEYKQAIAELQQKLEEQRINEYIVVSKFTTADRR